MFVDTGKLFAGNLVVTVCNLLRDIAIANTLGASAVADYFFLAISLPIFLITLAAGSYRMVVVPLLVRLMSNPDGSATRTAARLNLLNLAGIAAIACTCAAALGIAYAFFRGVMTPGHRYLIGLMLGVLPMYALGAFIELSQGALQVLGALFTPTVSRAALPAGIAFGAVWFNTGPGAEGLVAGGTAGAIVGAAAVAWQLSHHGAPIRRARTQLLPSHAGEFLRNFRALVISYSILALMPLIGQWLASLLGPGSVSTLGYANRLTVGVASLVSGALAPVLLGAFAQDTATASTAAANRFFDTITAFVWAGCAVTLGFWEISEYLIPLIYEHGHLTRADGHAVARVADWYALQFPLLLASTSTSSLISALALNRVFIPITSIVLASNVILTVVLMHPLGVAGIALASSLTYAISLALQLVALMRRAGICRDFAMVQRLSTPFLLLTGAAVLVFIGRARLAPDVGLVQATCGVLILATFLVAALVRNKALVRRAWAGIRDQ